MDIQGYLNDITQQLEMDNNEIFCVLQNVSGKKVKNILDFSRKFRNIHIKTEQDDLLKIIRGDYVFIIDSRVSMKKYEINYVYEYCKANQFDILLSSALIDNNPFTNNLFETDVFSHIDYSKEIFSLPKYIMNFYKMSFLRNNSLSLPKNMTLYENLSFFFKTMFLANRLTIKKDFLFSDLKDIPDINTIVVNDFKNNYSREEEYTLNFKKFFNCIYEILEFFRNNNLYNLNKYFLLNYIFDLFRNIYSLNLINKEKYFIELKKFVSSVLSAYNTDLVLNLSSNNLNFYRNILELKSIKELELIQENKKLEGENFVYHHLLDKFRTIILDFKNVNDENNRVEMVEFPKNIKSKVTLDKFRNSEGSGLSVISYNNVLDFKIKCINPGKLKVYARAIDLKDKKSHRMPIKIDLKKFIIGNEILLDKNRVISYEKPFRHDRTVENGEELDIHVEWAPLSYQSTYVFKKSSNPALLPFATARFDVKNVGDSDNDVEVIFNNDKSSQEYSPDWFMDNYGKGKVIESSKGEIDFSVKCVKSGKLNFFLRAIDFRDKNGARIPLKVDLEKLVVNSKSLLDENVLISHDNPFKYNLDVVDGDVVKVHAEWSPLSRKSVFFESSNVDPDLLPFTTARFDVKNVGDSDNDVEVVFNNDLNSREYSPGWLNNKWGKGKVIESFNGEIDFSVKCVKSGKLNFFLRAIDFRDKNGARIPLKVDLEKLVVNSKSLLDENVLISHDNPFEYNLDVVDGDVVKVHAEWSPLSRKSVFFESSNVDPDLLPFTTARFDVKNVGDSDNDVEVVFNNDLNSREYSPGWLNNKWGKGKVIESFNGEIDFYVKCVKSGKLNFFLRAIDFRDKNGVQIPLKVDLEKLVVNSKSLLDENVLISQDDPFEYKLDVVDGELVKVHAEWSPISNKSDFSFRKK